MKADAIALGIPNSQKELISLGHLESREWLEASKASRLLKKIHVQDVLISPRE